MKNNSLTFTCNAQQCNRNSTTNDESCSDISNKKEGADKNTNHGQQDVSGQFCYYNTHGYPVVILFCVVEHLTGFIQA